MGISLGVVVEDDAYYDRDIRGNCPDIVVYSAGADASTAIRSVWRLWLDNILSRFMTGF